jgi:ribonuclease P protein component
LRDNSLPKSIILKASEFNSVFEDGQFVKNEYFSIFFVNRDALKVGFAAPKKCGSKPVRNKLKRIGRELWRTNFRNYDLPAHLVIVVHKDNLKIKHTQRDETLKNLLHDIEGMLRVNIITE